MTEAETPWRVVSPEPQRPSGPRGVLLGGPRTLAHTDIYFNYENLVNRHNPLVTLEFQDIKNMCF